MVSISLCMIVKNEEKLLKRCLDSISDLVDEIVIVDTGSTDNTLSIASEYTDNIYHFEWVDDFSKARNFSFSKCSKDYIYVADADEYLDDANRLQFKLLKENLYPEIEIVQMMYETISNDTVLNIHREFRPKLYKRLREFTWIDPIHETVRLEPLVFDSDIVITHAPENNHSKRDFSIFEKAIKRDGGLSEKVANMYAIELYKCGNNSDFTNALPFFLQINEIDDDHIKKYSSVIIARGKRILNDNSFYEFVLSLIEAGYGDISELNFELGEYYLDKKDYLNASKYYSLSTHASSPILDVHSSGDTAIKQLINACQNVLCQYEELKVTSGEDEKMEGLICEYKELIEKYSIELKNWKIPEEEIKA